LLSVHRNHRPGIGLVLAIHHHIAYGSQLGDKVHFVLVLFGLIEALSFIAGSDGFFLLPCEIRRVYEESQKGAFLPGRGEVVIPFPGIVPAHVDERQRQEVRRCTRHFVRPYMMRHRGVVQFLDALCRYFPAKVLEVEDLLVAFRFGEVGHDKRQPAQLVGAEVLRPASDNHFEDIFRCIHIGKLFDVVAYLPRLYGRYRRGFEVYEVKRTVYSLVTSISPVIEKNTAPLVFELVGRLRIAVPVVLLDGLPILFVPLNGLCAFYLSLFGEFPAGTTEKELRKIFQEIFMQLGKLVWRMQCPQLFELVVGISGDFVEPDIFSGQQLFVQGVCNIFQQISLFSR